MPLPEKRPHAEVLMPEFPLAIWPYTDMTDSRLHWGQRYFTFTQDASKGPTKFGMALQLGWAGHLVHSTFFVKYFDFLPEAVYPDFGCNFETFSNEEMLEVGIARAAMRIGARLYGGARGNLAIVQRYPARHQRGRYRPRPSATGRTLIINSMDCAMSRPLLESSAGYTT